MKLLTFILVYSIYLNSFAKTMRCFDLVQNILARPFSSRKNNNNLSPLHTNLIDYARNQGISEQHLQKLQDQLKILPDDLTEKEGKTLLIDPLIHLEEDWEKSDTIAQFVELLENHRSIDHILTSSLAENLSETNRKILAYAFAYKIDIDIRQKLAKKLINLPEVLQWKEGIDFVHYILSLEKREQFLAIEHMDEIVTGYIKSEIIEEFIRLQGEVMRMESQQYLDYYRTLLMNPNKKEFTGKTMTNIQEFLGLGMRPHREILGLGPENKELIKRARRLTEEYMEQHRRFVYECRKRAVLKNTKHAVRSNFVSFSTWKRPAISIPFIFFYNRDRLLTEVSLQVVVEYFFKTYGYKISSKIVTGVRDSDLVKLTKIYGFGNVYGILTSFALYHVFSWAEGREEEEIFQEMMQDRNKRRELHDIILAMKNDGKYEKFVEELFINFGRTLGRADLVKSEEILSLDGIDWENLTAEDIQREDIRKVIKKAVTKYIYDKRREESTVDWFPASGYRAVDFWTFNSLYAIPMATLDYYFDVWIYNKFCKEATNISNAQWKMFKWYTGKRIISDIPYLFSRKLLIGI